MRALLAGRGELPAHVLVAAPDLLVCELEGFAPDLPEDTPRIRFRLEHLGSFLDDLAAKGVRDLCLAGAITRVQIDPSKIDAQTMPLVPQMTAALAEGGDDAALRALAGILEAKGFTLLAAHELAPDLLPSPGFLTGEANAALNSSVARAFEVLEALSPVDLGQGCVIRGTRVMAIEAAPGTDWMLASLSGGEAAGGVFVKAPKRGQDLRMDLPAIGPETMRGAARAGLSAVVIQAGGVMVLNRSETCRIAQDAGIALWVRP